MAQFSIKNIEMTLKSEDLKEVADAMLYLTFNVDDFDWAQNTILNMLDNSNEDISGLAITCLGHLSRIYPKADKQKIISALELKAKDERYKR